MRGRRLTEKSTRSPRHVPASRWRRHRLSLPRHAGALGIGKDASSGCIRMFNEDAIDLYQRCPIGTAVQVLPHIADQAESAAQVSQTTPVE
ncbi:L,D-transpeptidase [Rhizobium beringeri]